MNKRNEPIDDSKIKLDEYLAAAGSDRRSIYMYRESDFSDDEWEYAFQLSVLKGELLALKANICADEVASVSENRGEDILELDKRLSYISDYFSKKVDGQIPVSEVDHLPWAEQAWLLGQRFLSEDNSLTVAQIAKRVEEEFKNLDVRNNRGGGVLAAETIRKALAGITQKKDKKMPK